MQLELMSAKKESEEMYEKLNKLIQDFNQTDNVMKDKFEKFLNDSQSHKDVQKESQNQLNEIMDSKLSALLEKLRTDNLYIWKQSLELA